MCLIIGLILMGFSYISTNYAFAYCVHHIDKPNCNDPYFYRFFLNKFNRELEDEDNFIKLMVSWAILMISINLVLVGFLLFSFGITKLF